MIRYGSFTGTISMISDFWTDDQQVAGCYKLISLVDRNGSIVNFVVSPFTYIVDQETLKIGDIAVGFFDANAPTPLIYPPQYEAIVMARVLPYRNVKVDYFDSQLISSDGTLKLNISPFTLIVLENGLTFTGNLENRDLTVVYGPTTRSIPAQTTPYKIIVLCQ